MIFLVIFLHSLLLVRVSDIHAFKAKEKTIIGEDEITLNQPHSL